MIIRKLVDRDKKDWWPLWQGYLNFYEATVSEEVSEHTWQALCCDVGQGGFAAVVEGRMIGVAHFLFHASTWAVNDYCYLEDLFVLPEARGKGAARALIEAVADEAAQRGAGRVYWNTHQDNATARVLYDKLATLSPFLQYRR